jgi:hypothetical protein
VPAPPAAAAAVRVVLGPSHLDDGHHGFAGTLMQGLGIDVCAGGAGSVKIASARG